MGTRPDTGLLGDDLPFLDLTAPGFSTRGPEVLAARSRHALARTPFGIAVLRHDTAGRVLRDRRCRQGSHGWPEKVGLKGSFAAFWQRSIISQEGSTHKLQRRLAQSALATDDIRALGPAFEGIAERLVAALPESFDFVTAFSEPFAGQAITKLMGAPHEIAPALARDAATLGLAMGVEAKQHEASVNAATDRLMEMASGLLDNPTENSFVARLAEAARLQEFDDRQALLDLIVIAIFGGVDTTRAQLAFAVALFIDRPELWAALRANTDLIPAAIEDVIRHRPTTTWATRETVEAIDIEGVEIPAGTTLHVLVHASATDPATGYAGGFDPSVVRKAHFGFGGGAHHCLGHFVARTDMACALKVLVRSWRDIHWEGEPEWLPDSGNTSPRCLPIRPERA